MKKLSCWTKRYLSTVCLICDVCLKIWYDWGGGVSQRVPLAISVKNAVPQMQVRVLHITVASVGVWVSQKHRGTITYTALTIEYHISRIKTTRYLQPCSLSKIRKCLPCSRQVWNLPTFFISNLDNMAATQSMSSQQTEEVMSQHIDPQGSSLITWPRPL